MIANMMKALTHLHGLGLKKKEIILQFIDEIASENFTK